MALGVLGWTPDAFWRATPTEFWAAYDGWREVHGLRQADMSLTPDEKSRLEKMKLRFPDRKE